ncbi:MAG: EutN/CcmL family microcompartment protein [Planctomycetes bacterium]|nr:EutN/CcmL family microcompartment protein [Planctomycetota bacterium]
MLIGEVVGTVVSTQKDEKLVGLKFQIVREVDDHNRPTGAYVVAIDAVGAGHGDRVLFATGSSARQTVLTEGRPADAVIMAIIDSWDVQGDPIYSRQAPVER